MQKGERHLGQSCPYLNMWCLSLNPYTTTRACIDLNRETQRFTLNGFGHLTRARDGTDTPNPRCQVGYQSYLPLVICLD